MAGKPGGIETQVRRGLREDRALCYRPQPERPQGGQATQRQALWGWKVLPALQIPPHLSSNCLKPLCSFSYFILILFPSFIVKRNRKLCYNVTTKDGTVYAAEVMHAAFYGEQDEIDKVNAYHAKVVAGRSEGEIRYRREQLSMYREMARTGKIFE